MTAQFEAVLTSHVNRCLLSYPLLSVVALRNFLCIRVGDERYLVSDLAVLCPLDHSASSTFSWAVVCTCLYPTGLPVLVYVVLRSFNVPAIAQAKMEKAVVAEMLLRFRAWSAGSVLSRIAACVGPPCDANMLEKRIRDRFQEEFRANECISAAMIGRILGELTAEETAEVREMVETYGGDQPTNTKLLDLKQFGVCSS